MSTLPDLFRNTQSVYLPPAKQGGIFSIKRKQSQDIETLDQKYSQSRLGTSSTIRTKHKGKYSVNLNQRPYSRQSLGEKFLKHKASKSSIAIYQNQPNVEEADNLKVKLNECLNSVKIFNEDFKEMKQSKCKLTKQFQQVESRIDKQISEIQSNMKYQISQIRKKLSQMRRVSGMETKINKQDTNQLRQNYEMIGCVLSEIQENSDSLYTECLS